MRTLSGRLALPLLVQLKRDGHDVQSLLKRLHLDHDELRSFGGRLAVDAWLDLRQAGIDATGDPSFPLRAALGLDRESFPLGFYLMGTQATLRDGYQFVRPYIPIIMSGLEVNMLVSETEQSYVDFVLDGEPVGPPAFAEYLVAIVIALGRWLTPEAPPPTEIILAHRWPRHSDAMAELLGAPVRFGGGAVRMVFPAARIDTPIAGADPHLGQLLAQKADEQARQIVTTTRVRDRARHYLSRHLEGHEPTVLELAEALRVTERTLRRKLRSEGTSPRELLDEVRHERALALLEEGQRSLDEIAYVLGFSGAGAFRRAFRRWTGVAPTEYGNPR
ncbi:MAG: AraC family transcriptional regulator ligand-binding domain-containing protein [Sandaracinaceae bacterium]|nr:AraC family transcriptional regulator ligand-binding domain-containing protein [Sandaracinaceae bacterium]MBK7151525.1 AraC family transcriptional regulator ligand-binding domain-containing protein [Sandaracinaceae bacterium]MBK8412137.1 AraC family transcriptional regulator ligand-binding domain-containing protein [Sandaracinaceae bacterium]MBK8593335.1 AraC family transcriptional regulator ligand-binding domain-containing protein [Sandaracinaceae bacterium]